MKLQRIGIKTICTMVGVLVVAVALLGPLGLAAYITSYRQAVRSPELQAAVIGWRRALGATVLSVTGYRACAMLGELCS